MSKGQWPRAVVVAGSKMSFGHKQTSRKRTHVFGFACRRVASCVTLPCLCSPPSLRKQISERRCGRPALSWMSVISPYFTDKTVISVFRLF